MNWWNLVPGVPLDIYKANDNWDFNKDSTEVNTSLFCELDGLGQINLSYYDDLRKGTNLTGTPSSMGGSYTWNNILPDFGSFLCFNGNNGQSKIMTIAYLDTNGNLKAGTFDLMTKTYTNLFTIASSDIPATTNLDADHNVWHTPIWGAEINDAGELILGIFVSARNQVTGQPVRGSYWIVARAYNSNGTIKTSSTIKQLQETMGNLGQSPYPNIDLEMRTIISSDSLKGRCLAKKSGNEVGFVAITGMFQRDYTSPSEFRQRIGTSWIKYNGSTFSNSYQQKQITSYRQSGNGRDYWITMVDGTVYTYGWVYANTSNGSSEDSYVYYWTADPLTTGSTTNIYSRTGTSYYEAYREIPQIVYLGYFKFVDGYRSSSTSRYNFMKTYYLGSAIQNLSNNGNISYPTSTQNLIHGGIESRWQNTGETWIQHNHITLDSSSISAFSHIGSVSSTVNTSINWYWFVDNSKKYYFYMTHTGFTLAHEMTSYLTYTDTLVTPLEDIKKLFCHTTLFLNTEAKKNYAGFVDKLVLDDGVTETEQITGTWNSVNLNINAIKIKSEFIGASLISNQNRGYIVIYKK